MADSFSREDLRELLRKLEGADTDWQKLSSLFLGGLLLHLSKGKGLSDQIQSVGSEKIYPEDIAAKELPTLNEVIQNIVDFLYDSNFFSGKKQEETFFYYLDKLRNNQNRDEVELFLKKLRQLALVETPEQAPKSWQEEAAETFRFWLGSHQSQLQSAYTALYTWEKEFEQPSKLPVPSSDQLRQIQSIQELSRQYRRNESNPPEVTEAVQKNTRIQKAQQRSRETFVAALKDRVKDVHLQIPQHTTLLFPAEWLPLTRRTLESKQNFEEYLSNSFQPEVVSWAAWTARLIIDQIEPALASYIEALQVIAQEEYEKKFQEILQHASDDYQSELSLILGGSEAGEAQTPATTPATSESPSTTGADTTPPSIPEPAGTLSGGSTVPRVTPLETPTETAAPAVTNRPTIRDVGNISRLQENLINLSLNDLQKRFESDPQIKDYCSRHNISIATLVQENRGAIRDLIWAELLSSGGLSGKVPATVLTKMWVNASDIVYAEMNLATDLTENQPVSYTEIMSRPIDSAKVQQTEALFNAGDFEMQEVENILYNIEHNDFYLETVSKVAEEINTPERRQELLQQVVEETSQAVQASPQVAGAPPIRPLTPDQEYLLQYTIRDHLQVFQEGGIDLPAAIQNLPPVEANELSLLLAKALEKTQNGRVALDSRELKRFDELMQRTTPAWLAIRQQAPQVAALFYGQETLSEVLELQTDLQQKNAKILDTVLQQVTDPERQKAIITRLVEAQGELSQAPALRHLLVATQPSLENPALPQALADLTNPSLGAKANIFAHYAAATTQATQAAQQGKKGVVPAILATFTAAGGKGKTVATGKTEAPAGKALVTWRERAALTQMLELQMLRDAQGGILSKPEWNMLMAAEYVVYGIQISPEMNFVVGHYAVPTIEQPLSSFDDAGMSAYSEAAQQYSPAIAADQRASVNDRLGQARAALQLARAAMAGGPAGLALAIAQNPELQSLIQKHGKKAALLGTGLLGAGVGAAIYSMLKPLLAALKALSSAVNAITGAISGIGNFVGGIFGGGGGPVNPVLGEAMKDALAANAGNAGAATNALSNAANSTLNSAVNGINSASSKLVGLNTHGAIIAGGILGPFGLAGLMTIIVIIVIGGSMNDIPFGEGLYTPGGQVSGKICWPVDARITQLNTPDHDTNRAKAGTAYDFGVATGTEVYAPFSGTYMFYPAGTGPYTGGTIGKDGLSGYGHYAVIQGDNGITTILGHLQDTAIASGVRVGASELVAYSDDSGNSSGPHLHWEVYGVVIDEIAPETPVTVGMQVSHLTCAGSDDVSSIDGVDCIKFSSDGWGDTDRAMVVKQLGVLKGQFPEYMSNICSAVGGDIVLKRDSERLLGSYPIRADGGHYGEITLYDVLFDEDGPAGVLYTLSHELVHQWQRSGSGLMEQMRQEVYGGNFTSAKPSPYDFYSATQGREGDARLEETLAETAAWYIQNKLGNTHSKRPYQTYDDPGNEYYDFYEFARDHMFSAQ